MVKMKFLVQVMLGACLPMASALGQKQIISFQSKGDDLFQLAGGKVNNGQIRVSDNEYWGVVRAAGDLAVDFGSVTKSNLTLSNGRNGAEPAEFRYNPVDVRNNTIVSLHLRAAEKAELTKA